MINFHELYNKYAKDVYQFVYWLSGNSQDAEDITSETFMRAIINKNTLKIKTIKAYLLTIARNLYLQKIRNKRHHIELDENIHDGNPIPDKLAEFKSDLEITLKAIQNLQEPDRSILIMHAQHGLSYPEIAGIFGLSISAVKVKVHRARLKLQIYLRGENK